MTSNQMRCPGRWRTGACTVLALIMGACASPPSTVKKYDFQSAVAAFKRSTIPAGKPVIRQQSGVMAFESKDEMEGTAAYYIYVRAEDYSSIRTRTS